MFVSHCNSLLNRKQKRNGLLRNVGLCQVRAALPVLYWKEACRWRLCRCLHYSAKKIIMCVISMDVAPIDVIDCCEDSESSHLNYVNQIEGSGYGQVSMS